MLGFCKICGSFPFLRKSNHFKISPPWLAYSVGLAVLFQCLQARKCYDQLLKFRNAPIDELIFNFSQEVYKNFAHPLCLALVIFRRQSISLFELTVQEVERKCKRIRLKSENPRNFLASCLLANSLILAVLNQYLEFDVIAFATIAVYHLALVGCVLQFNTFVSVIVGYMKVLNKSFESFSQHDIKAGFLQKLLAMADIQYLLTEASAHLNSAYSSTYLVLTSVTVWSLVFTGYRVFYVLLVKDDVPQAVQTAIWWWFWFLLTNTMVEPCSTAYLESIKFNRLLSNVLNKIESQGKNLEDEEPCQKRMLRLHADFEPIIKFSCGFFELNRSLIHGVLGGVATFVVILIQVV